MDAATSRKVKAWFASQRERGAVNTDRLTFELSIDDVFSLPKTEGPALGVDFVEASQPHVLVDVGPFISDKKSFMLRIEQRMSEHGIGAVVWNCGRTMCSLMHRLPECTGGSFSPGLCVLELGSGTGIVGMACALRGASVTMTDLPDNLDLARANARANDVDVIVEELEWGSESTFTQSQFDLVIGSDCLYDANALPSLLKTLVAVTHADSVVYLAYKVRVVGRERPFFEEASSYFKNVRFSDANETPEQWRGSGLHICRLSEKIVVV